MRKRSGDNYPVDVKGKMMFLGCIVCVPYIEDAEATVEGPAFSITTELRLGYVSKITQKRGFDVTIYHDIDKTEVVRFTNPHVSINVIDSKELKTVDKFHEAIRFAAKMAQDDGS